MLRLKLMGATIHIARVPRARIGKDELGEYVPEFRQINIADDLTLEAERRVVMHEVVHAVLDISGVSAGILSGLEETICTALENLVPVLEDGSLLQVIADCDKIKNTRRKR